MIDSTVRIADNLASTRSEISEYERRYLRSAGSVNLLAVSKKKPISAIESALAAGQSAFGENYVDEGVEKVRSLTGKPIEWHFIGAIQSRKCRQIAEHFQWVHSVDRLKVAQKLSAARPESLPALQFCLQINLDLEASKAGIRIEEVADLAQQCAELPRLRLRGLMAIPAPRQSLQQQRQVFAQLANCLKSLQETLPHLDTLSMGMSADIEAAIAEGSTIVRVGTAIFGARDS